MTIDYKLFPSKDDLLIAALLNVIIRNAIFHILETPNDVPSSWILI